MYWRQTRAHDGLMAIGTLTLLVVVVIALRQQSLAVVTDGSLVWQLWVVAAVLYVSIMAIIGVSVWIERVRWMDRRGQRFLWWLGETAWDACRMAVGVVIVTILVVGGMMVGLGHFVSRR